MNMTPSLGHQAILLKEEGYVQINSLFSEDFTNHLVGRIQARLHHCAQELRCTYQDYLRVASRWVSPSPVTEDMEEVIINPLRSLLQDLTGASDLVKLNVISKTPSSPEALPFHQDIAYSPENSYQFSAWLALTDAPLESGPMEVVVGSHKGPIEPAVDFWGPKFKDKVPLQRGVKRKLPVKAGDLIIFDSRLWHGSGKNKSHNERFALVTRWKERNYVPPFIPPLKPLPFGMWTCQRETEKLLTKGLHILFQKKPTTYRGALEAWSILLKNKTLPFLKNPQRAQESLRHVFLLNEAHHAHNGSDAQGVVYARLWESLLAPLSLYLHQQQGDLNG